MSLGRAVFFDRDGTLVVSSLIDGVPVPCHDINLLKYLDDAPSICIWLKRSGIKTFLVTNQPDIARGRVSIEDVEKINSRILQDCQLTDIAMCIHDDKDNCNCRKPKSGMLRSLSREHNIDLLNSLMIGDRSKDISAGFDAGCKTIFLDHGYGETSRVCPNHSVRSLKDMIQLIANFFDIPILK